MNAQAVVEENHDFDYLGGHEGVGSQGGYYNIRSRFPKLLEFPTVQRWLRKKSPNTKAEYLLRFEKLLRWTLTDIQVSNPEELLAWAKKQNDGTVVQDLIDEYTEGMSKSKAHVEIALFRSFLSRNGYRDLPKIDWERTMSFSEGYNREQVQDLISNLRQPLHRLYVLAGKDSGLRANDLLYLRYRHIKKDLEAGQKFVHVEFEKERYNRKKAPGRTFLGPNTIDLLNKLISQGVVKAEPDAKIFPFVYRTITNALTLAKKRAGLTEVQPSHGLRKFYESCLDRVGMDHNKKMQLEGHSAGVRDAYTSQHINELRELYGQAYRYLDLSEKAVVSNEVQELQKKIIEQAQHIESLKGQVSDSDSAYQKIEKSLARMEKRIEELEKQKD